MHYSLKAIISSYEFDMTKIKGTIQKIEKETISSTYTTTKSRIYFSDEYVEIKNCDFIGKVGDEVIVVYVNGNNIKHPIFISNITLKCSYTILSFDTFKTSILRIKTGSFVFPLFFLPIGLSLSVLLYVVLQKLHVWTFFIYVAMFFPMLFIWWVSLQPLLKGIGNLIFSPGSFVFQKEIDRIYRDMNNEIKSYSITTESVSIW